MNNCNYSDNMMRIIKNIFPLSRRFNSDDMDKSYEIVMEQYPDIKLYSYPSGMICEDWVVPYKWKLLSGVLKDNSGTTLVSSDEDLLFVAAYSEAVDGWFTKDEILKHSLVHPTLENAFMFQHRLGFNLENPNWGISLSKSLVDKLDDDQLYYINIDIEKKDGDMKVAEWVLPGATTKTICIAAHIDEQLCNDDLSGCAVGLELMALLEKYSDRKYRYQLLLFPETLGSFVHMYNNLDDFTDTVCQLNLEIVGAGKQLKIKHSFKQNTPFDNILEMALQHNKIDYGHLNFFDGYCNDERTFEWPTFGIPGVGLQRHPFKYYHTSFDTPEIIEPKLLEETLEVAKTFVDILEKDYIPAYTSILPPKLSKYGLYFDAITNRENFKKFNNDLLYLINGENKLSVITKQLDVDFFEAYDYLEKFVELTLIVKKNFE